jgi:GT2 family glycosyltransferase
MQVAVIILNWNGQKLLEEFLPTVVDHSPQARIYLADNASADSSLTFVNKHFPEVKCIALDKNYGYAGGYNRAIRQVNEELLVLLNSDVAVSSGWLEPVIKAFEEDNKLAAAQPKILDYRRPGHFEYAGAAGGFIDRLAIPYCRGRIFNHLEMDNGQYDRDSAIFWASGACLIIRRSFFEEAGGLDEDLFAHQEEIDLCWRLQVLGGKVGYLHRSKVLHLGGGTLDSANPKKTYLNFRNTLLLLYKNVAGPGVYPILLLRLFIDGMAALYFLFGGRPRHFAAVLKAHFGFYRLIPTFRPKRKRWATHLKYYTIFSIVYAGYVKKKRRYDQLT